jgi:NAD(P)-dependent dehydrogenase (short-subunit alcohol dehydrogenase family)
MPNDLLSFDMTDRVAVVTGASRGIGAGLARALAQAGAKVVAAARDADLLAAIAEEIGGEALVLDVTSLPSIQEGIDGVVARHGRIDILVNNAGLGANHPALEVTEAAWDEMFDVNLKGLFFCCQAAARHMVERRYGRIVNMSSQASLVGIREHAVYCATKGGVNLLTKVLALEFAPYGVTVNAVAPTFIHTPGTAERLDDPEFANAR